MENREDSREVAFLAQDCESLIKSDILFNSGFNHDIHSAQSATTANW
jgi:hypothetical protein